MLPDIACRISSCDGLGFAPTSAAAETTCAKPALDGVGPNERSDQRVVAETFDRRHLAIADRVHERDARERRDTVELDGARTAVSLAARDLRAGEPEVFA